MSVKREERAGECAAFGFLGVRQHRCRFEVWTQWPVLHRLGNEASCHNSLHAGNCTQPAASQLAVSQATKPSQLPHALALTSTQHCLSSAFPATATHRRFSRFGIQYKRTRSLHQWRDWAPALLDNYVIRVLLGRKFMHCL